MRKYIRRLFLRLASRFEDPNGEQFNEGFEGLPDANKRALMTPLALAQLLAKCKEKSPAYIVIEHELNLQIAKVQSKATLSAGRLGFLGALLGAVLGAWLGYVLGTLSPQKPQEQICRCECSSAIQKSVTGLKPSAR
jgi:hypothetical protein